MKSGIANLKDGSRRIIIYGGEVTDFGDKLAEAAEKDPDLERQITIAALSLQYTRMSRDFGEQMIEMVNSK
ncbi:MAG TPA: hypothetical protein DCR40_10030 [Prolixibacteraceae bacterium]|nr:MAG: hypothetical protein US34_C0024G0003 [Candidatus Nomurabacteria bacterium GW2011_GWC2_36_9]HAQ19552.1 hypothetical protein [Prolixibacteraceae bacterium]